MRTVVVVFAVARLYPAEVIVHYHCLNDRVVKNPPPVGASIARPLLAGGAIRISASNSRFYRRRTVNIGSVLYFTRALFPCRCGILYKRFCDSPTGDIVEIFFALACCFTSLQFSQADGQWPPLRQRYLRTPHHFVSQYAYPWLGLSTSSGSPPASRMRWIRCKTKKQAPVSLK